MDFGAWALLPPALAIVFAMLTRRVYQSLLLGILVAGVMVAGAETLGNTAGWLVPFAALFGGFVQAIVWVVNGLATTGHAAVMLFTLFLGALIAVMQRSGAVRGFGEAAMRYAKTPRIGQGLAWGAGALFLAIDDYFHVIAAGSVFRPITDKLKVSREKLAYIIDSTAAPMVILIPISTWVGVILGVVSGVDAVENAGLNAFTLFLQGIPFNFYAILTVAFVGLIALLPMEYGPMRLAEERAAKGQLLREGAKPLAAKELSDMEPAPEARPSAWNLLLPILFLFASTLIMLVVTGFDGADVDQYGASDVRYVAAQADGIDQSSLVGALQSASAEISLAVSSFLTLGFATILYMARRTLRHDAFMDASIQGFKAMVPALTILALAWAIGNAVGTTQDAMIAAGDSPAPHSGGVGLGDWLASSVADSLNPASLPLLAFALSAGIAFGTGTSFGTFGIMIPITLSLAGAGGTTEWFAPVLAATLGGAVFGDHCSPISDTTVMSSMAGHCDHIDHVKTQLPYAMTVAGIAVVGYLLVWVAEAAWLAWISNILLLAGVAVVGTLLARRRAARAA